MKSKLLEDLKDVVQSGLTKNPLPIIKGNSIRIGRRVIRKRRHSFMVYDIPTKEVVCETNFLSSAIAIAKGKAPEKILDLDMKLLKHTNDANHYAHMVNTTKDDIVRDTRWVRYEIACADADRVKDKIYEYVS